MGTSTHQNQRLPRPLGITSMAIEYKKSGSDETLSNMYTYFINQWFMGSGVICGNAYDINTLSRKFNIDPQFIKTFMRDSVLNSRIWSVDNQEQLLNGLLGEQLAWAIEDRMEVVQQVNLLKASQNGKYTPFISAELNKALKLRLDSSSSLQTIIRNLTGGGNTNIFQQFNQVENIQNNNITIEQAREIVEDSMTKLPPNESVKLLETKYNINELPVVVATEQTGIDTGKEGISAIDKIELNSITDNYKGALESYSKDHHELRREIEQNIDPYEEDPELDIYEEINDEEEDKQNNPLSYIDGAYNSLDGYLK